MKVHVALLMLAVAATGRTSAIPTDKDRIKDKKLSDELHFEGSDHNANYDHDAFLGKEEAKTFEDLSPEESKRRLGLIVDKIDKDTDGKVTEEELKNWIHYVQNDYIMKDTKRQWADHEVKEGEDLTWDQYKARVYGGMSDEEAENEPYNYKDMMARDEKRWKKADENGDNKLNLTEFAAFLHPEDVERMRDVVVEETLADIDKDKDGFISVEEYIGDMWPEGSEGEEPEWVKNEREQFSQYRDRNNDGKMDRAEVREWIVPPDYDHSEAEAKHLINEADENKDGHLSKEEILHKHDVFAGSQATDYGDALMRHQEL